MNFADYLPKDEAVLRQLSKIKAEVHTEMILKNIRRLHLKKEDAEKLLDRMLEELNN